MAGYSRRLLIQDGGRTVFLEVADIDWIEAARNYACIHTGPHTYIMRSSLDSLACKLDSIRVPPYQSLQNRQCIAHCGAAPGFARRSKSAP